MIRRSLDRAQLSIGKKAWDEQATMSGLSNKAIAARLNLSVRTIDGHVERVLKKLELRSRVGIGTWAVERNLLG